MRELRDSDRLRCARSLGQTPACARTPPHQCRALHADEVEQLKSRLAQETTLREQAEARILVLEAQIIAPEPSVLDLEARCSQLEACLEAVSSMHQQAQSKCLELEARLEMSEVESAVRNAEFYKMAEELANHQARQGQRDSEIEERCVQLKHVYESLKSLQSTQHRTGFATERDARFGTQLTPIEE